MKKYTFILTTLIMSIFFSGCRDKITNEYSGMENINVEQKISNEMARIDIKDTYKKSGIEYFVFTTDITDDREFTLSEAAYDKYIGLGNNAVDCTVYNLNLKTTLFDYNFFLLPKKEITVNSEDTETILEVINKIEDVDAPFPIFSSSKVHISNAYGTEFGYDEYILYVPYEEKKLNEEIDLYRYSFAGETDFTEEEIKNYKQIMDKVSFDYLSVVQ